MTLPITSIRAKFRRNAGTQSEFDGNVKTDEIAERPNSHDCRGAHLANLREGLAGARQDFLVDVCLALRGALFNTRDSRNLLDQCAPVR